MLCLFLVGCGASEEPKASADPDSSTKSSTVEKPQKVESEPFHVIFTDGDGTVIAEMDATKPSEIKAPSDPVREGYEFDGWDADLSKIEKDATVNAKWAKLCTVTFADGDGNEIASVQVKEGGKAKAPDDPTKDGMEFTGWDADFSKVTEDMTVNATWATVYTVTFLDGEGAELESVTVREGESAKAPKTPSMDGMDFTGWDADFSSVTEDMTVNATWKAKPTVSQSNAVRKAKDYLSFMAFSYSGLIDQLEYEGYSTEDATYGVDNCGADWYEQAAEKAQDYLDFMAFSRSGLIEQLEYEGFSYDEAVYGVDSVGL